MNVKRGMAVLGTACAVSAAVLATTASPSTAATGKNGVVELYYLQNFNGPVFDLFLSDSNFANDVFPGTGINADNNTESDWNRDTFVWHVWTGANYTGNHGCINPGVFGNFNNTYRNTVSSAYFASTC